jgi:superfamily II DNA/RNA helicase
MVGLGRHACLVVMMMMVHVCVDADCCCLASMVIARYEKSSILVFVEKQDRCDDLYRRLLQAGYPALSLHGGMDQFDRNSTITDFKKGEVPLMVSTSLVARGLDVPNLNLVVNFDPPNHYEVHKLSLSLTLIVSLARACSLVLT